MNTSLTKEVFVNSYAADQKNSIEFGKEEEVLFLSNNEAEFIFSMSIYENGLKSRKINWIRIFLSCCLRAEPHSKNIYNCHHVR